MGFPEPGAKRHAVRKDDPDSPLYWVGDETDWDEVRRRPRVALECPERCGVELVSVENAGYRFTPRFLRVKPPQLPCDHWESGPGLGGRESPQHDWLKNRLAVIARNLGYSAVVEHWPTHADVYVLSSPPYCLEIQLGATAFAARTRARVDRGARVCWLIRDGLGTAGASEALAKAQAVRFRVVSERRRIVQLWRSSPGDATDAGARIEVFEGIAGRPSDPLKAGESWFRADVHIDAEQFLDEILSGRRRPYSASQLGLKQAAWALEADVASYRDFSRTVANRQSARPGRVALPVPAARPTASSGLRAERERVAERPDESARATVQAQAVRDLARRIGEIETRIAELAQRGPETGPGPPADASTQGEAPHSASLAEIGTLTVRLQILRRQLALLPKRLAPLSPSGLSFHQGQDVDLQRGQPIRLNGTSPKARTYQQVNAKCGGLNCAGGAHQETRGC